MRPLTLTMQAFSSYGNQVTIDFQKPSQNLFLITGDTGSGKTTIFDAIVFALYGQASSVSNKKDGFELQSQYLDALPFVELTFSEQGEIYTVRRVPRHMQKKKTRAGEKKMTETVSLILPDGSEYSQNRAETNQKITEIVGLTQSQFMQVAMIAQGEFMQLLRADSGEKKLIFRRLFGTELYQNIVEELDSRRRAMETKMAKIRTECQTEIGHVLTPDFYEQAEELESLRAKILSADRLSSLDLEAMMAHLTILTGLLNNQYEKARKEAAEASLLRDRQRDALHQGTALSEAFRRLDAAKQELADCRQQQEAVEASRKLLQKITTAYEIRDRRQWLVTAEKDAEDTAADLLRQKQLLPGLADAQDRSARKLSSAEAEQTRAREAFARVSQKYETACLCFEKIRELTKITEEEQAHLENARAREEAAKQALTDAEAEEKEKQQLLEQLQDAPILYEKWAAGYESLQELKTALEEARDLEETCRRQEQQVTEARQIYNQALNAYLQKNQQYIDTQNAFLNAQAGFLARENLKPGLPCPVCGSIHHPSPCVLSEEHRDLTRETVDALLKEAEVLNKQQQTAAGTAQAAGEVLTEKNIQLSSRLQKLREKVSADLSPEADLTEISRILLAKEEKMDAEGKILKGNLTSLQKVTDFLKTQQEERKTLSEKQQKAAEAAAQAANALTQAQASLQTQERQKEFDSQALADQALAEARHQKEEAEQAAKQAKILSEADCADLQHCRTLLGQFEEALPGKQRALQEQEAAYQAILIKKSVTEQEWMETADAHRQEETESLEKQISDYDRKLSRAQGSFDAASAAVADQKEPDLPSLQQAAQQAQEVSDEISARLEDLKKYRDADQNTLLSLSPKMEERKALTEEFNRICSLYRRLAGKETGARMDIETYVQRYYLQRVLYCANQRFSEMSAGQFVLRMTDDDQAGEGKNRGLDLMVYSTVTGKQREVRTLSGGESFMAALSLALGMADQIQAGSASVHLDMMFIDEGFGSLDSHSRDQAVRVLKEMAGGSRLIGIISHVTELQTTIDDQLQVKKDENGSHAQWVLS